MRICSDRIGPICVHAWQRQHNRGITKTPSCTLRRARRWRRRVHMIGNTLKKTIYVDFHFYSRDPSLLSRGNTADVEWYWTSTTFARAACVVLIPDIFSGGSDSKRYRTNSTDIHGADRRMNGKHRYIKIAIRWKYHFISFYTPTIQRNSIDCQYTKSS